MAEAFGLEVPDLPEQWVALRVAAIVECLNEDGDVALAVRYSDDLSLWVTLGMVEAAAITIRDDLAGCFLVERTDDDEE